MFGISPLLSRFAIRHFFIELLVEKIVDRGSQLIRSQFFPWVVVTLKGAWLLLDAFVSHAKPPLSASPRRKPKCGFLFTRTYYMIHLKLKVSQQGEGGGVRGKQTLRLLPVAKPLACSQKTEVRLGLLVFM